MFPHLDAILAQAGRCMSDKANVTEFTAGIIPEPHGDGFTVWNLDVTRLPGIARATIPVMVLPSSFAPHVMTPGQHSAVTSAVTSALIRSGVFANWHRRGAHQRVPRDGCPLCKETT